MIRKQWISKAEKTRKLHDSEPRRYITKVASSKEIGYKAQKT